ncbi:MAG: GNAT family N-acetyltransferase [Arcicella sp.]|nr:GNAT family N-acetyltransferase [Arcicella sp.]
MIFNLRKSIDADIDLTYKIKKKCLQKYLEMLWGWNEEAQADFHRKHYQKERFSIIEIQNKSIGYLEIEFYENYIFLANLMILQKFQNQGIGKIIMESLIKNHPNIQLEVLKVNHKAKRFYEGFNFIVFEVLEDSFRMKIGF